MFSRLSQLQSLVGLVLLKKKQRHTKNKKLAVVKFEENFEIAEICLHSKMQMFF